MTAMTVEVATGYDDNDDIVLETLPAVYVVCHDCEGHGAVLNASMRYHAYSAEEFDDSFDDEDDRDAYFQRGGKYDVVCPTCKGARVILSVDEGRCGDGENKAIWDRHCEFEGERSEQRRIDAQVYRMECGIW
jgi:RecJ-like exonuclease